ncbi:MAG: hypothetical protein HUU47_06615 [Bacteroidetes bacterium]|nr:hypothetical protein [Bacteroidota bacterium]
MIKKSLFIILFSMLFSFLINSCKNDVQDDENSNGIMNIKLEVELSRFDVDLFNAKTADDILKLKNKYPDFYPVYVYQIMNGISGDFRTSEKESAINLLKNFITVPDFGLWLKQRADTVFPNLDDFKKDLTLAMKHYKFYFQKDTIPHFITFLSPLVVNFPFIEGTNQIGVGLDMYLGSDFKPYHSYNLADQFPNYRIRKMRKDYLLRDLITAIVVKKIEKANLTGKRLIDDIITEGKTLYITNALIPQIEDSIKLGWTPNQLEWALKYESDIWAKMVDSKCLYSTKQEDIRDYLNDGPFTTADGFGAGTAPRIGAYIGWQIIKKYINNYPKTSLEQLILLKDADEILIKSKYKP